MTYFLLGVVFFMALLVATSYYIITKAYHPTTQTHDEAILLERKANTYDQSFLNHLTYTPFTLQSDYGYHIAALWIPNEHQTNKIVLISHGYECTYHRSLKYVKMFKRLGYSICVMDHRFHGDSGGSFTSFGYYEKDDLVKLMDYIEEKYGTKETFYLVHGSSMGAAIALQFAAIDKRINAVISESSFASLTDQIKETLPRPFNIIKPLFLKTASLLSYIFYGFWLKEVHPEQAIQSINVPILIMHGDCDAFIPLSHAKRLKNARDTIKLNIIKGADHGLLYNTDPTQYEQLTKNFLEGINNNAR